MCILVREDITGFEKLKRTPKCERRFSSMGTGVFTYPNERLTFVLMRGEKKPSHPQVYNLPRG